MNSFLKRAYSKALAEPLCSSPSQNKTSARQVSAADHKIGRFTEYAPNEYKITKRSWLRAGDYRFPSILIPSLHPSLHTVSGLIVLVLTRTSFPSGSALFQIINRLRDYRPIIATAL